MSYRLASVALAAALATAPAVANEYTHFSQVRVTPLGDEGLPRCATDAMLSLPPAWQPGDAAVVVVSTSSRPDAMRDPIVAALLLENAAVLELIPGGCEGATDARADAADAFAGGLAALRGSGAGFVVAIGQGEAGAAAAMDMVRESAAASRLGPAGPRFAAAVGLGGAAPAFAAGVMSARIGQARLGAFCDTLAEAEPVGAAGAARCTERLAQQAALQNVARAP